MVKTIDGGNDASIMMHLFICNSRERVNFVLVPEFVKVKSEERRH